LLLLGGDHGQLGHGNRVNKVKPTLVQALEGIFINQITCGWSHSVALTAAGRVYNPVGNGDHGKLGHGSGRKLSVPQMVEKLKDYRVVKVSFLQMSIPLLFWSLLIQGLPVA
jgi:RCC1 and BTB domain-containing protein